MGKTTIYCVRHAQGYHNLSTSAHSIPDPLLTPHGHTQCATIAHTFPSQHITHLVASPLRRTLYTALLSFPEPVERGLRITALPELQETSNLPCDTGSERGVLEAEFGTRSVDLARVEEGWNSKRGRWAPSAPAIEKRARDARVWLRDLAGERHGDGDGDVHVVVVSHGTFLHYLTGDWEGSERFTGTGWVNCERRDYEFVGGKEDAEAGLRETRESRESRGLKGEGLGREEQGVLRAAAESQWRVEGYQSDEEGGKL